MSRAAPRAGRAAAPRRLPRAARREAILRAATEAFSGAGYAATSMADVARASGITQLIVYRHFDSKQDLYCAVLQRVRDGLSAEFARGPEPGGFGLGAGSVLSAARRDPTGFRLLWRHAAREPSFASFACDLREEAIASARASLARSVPGDSLEWAAHAVLGYLVEAVLNWLEFGNPARDARFVAATNAAMRAGVRVWSRPDRPRRRRRLPG